MPNHPKNLVRSTHGRVGGYVLLSLLSSVFLYAAPFTAAVLWYESYAWRTSRDATRNRLAVVLVALAVAMTAYSALVVTGLPVDSEFAAGPIR